MSCQWVSTIQVAGVFLKRWYIWYHNDLFPQNSFEPAGALVEHMWEWSICPSPRPVQGKSRRSFCGR
eukprot:7530584-Prorocentrum_lima.AAC.1